MTDEFQHRRAVPHLGRIAPVLCNELPPISGQVEAIDTLPDTKASSSWFQSRRGISARPSSMKATANEDSTLHKMPEANARLAFVVEA